MARLPVFLAAAVLLAVSSAAVAQSATTTTSTTVDTVKMTGSKGAPRSGAGTESQPDLSAAPQDAHPVLPTLTPPQSGDAHG